jgi:hypothetical protein
VRLTGGRSIEALKSGQVDVWTASASNVEQVANRLPGAKIVPGTFMSDRTMVILPKGRSSAAQAKVVKIINEAKKTVVARKALDRRGEGRSGRALIQLADQFCSCSGVEQLASIDDEGVAGDERGFVGNEKQYAVGNFLGCSHAQQRFVAAR